MPNEQVEQPRSPVADVANQSDWISRARAEYATALEMPYIVASPLPGTALGMALRGLPKMELVENPPEKQQPTPEKKAEYKAQQIVDVITTTDGFGNDSQPAVIAGIFRDTLRESSESTGLLLRNINRKLAEQGLELQLWVHRDDILPERVLKLVEKAVPPQRPTSIALLPLNPLFFGNYSDATDLDPGGRAFSYSWLQWGGDKFSVNLPANPHLVERRHLKPKEQPIVEQQPDTPELKAKRIAQLILKSGDLREPEAQKVVAREFREAMDQGSEALHLLVESLNHELEPKHRAVQIWQYAFGSTGRRLLTLDYTSTTPKSSSDTIAVVGLHAPDESTHAVSDVHDADRWGWKLLWRRVN